MSERVMPPMASKSMAVGPRIDRPNCDRSPATLRAAQFFLPLFAGDSSHLTPFFSTASPETLSEGFSASEGDAVVRGATTPDVALVTGPEESLRRVLREIVRLRLSRGERIAIVTPDEEATADIRLLLSGLDPHDPTRNGHVKVGEAAARQRISILRPSLEAYRSGQWWRLGYWKARRHPEWIGELADLEKALGSLSHSHLGNGKHSPEARILFGAPEPSSAGGTLTLLVWQAERIARDRFLDAATPASAWIMFGRLLPGDDDSVLAQLWPTCARAHWDRDGNRLRCRLKWISAADRAGLCEEPLADAADIVLRFSQTEDGATELAEITFPGETTLSQAKAFVAQNLDRWPVDLNPAALSWSDQAGQVVACLGCQNRHQPISVPTESGVHELIAQRDDAAGDRLPWFTCGFTFDRAAGWDRPKAETWLRERLVDHASRRAVRVESN